MTVDGSDDPGHRLRRFVADGLDLHRRYLKDVERAARLLTTCRASAAEQEEAHFALAWFTTEYLRATSRRAAITFSTIS